MTAATIRISQQDSKTIRIDRGSGVGGVFWGRVGAEWGYSGGNPSSFVLTTIELFLSNLLWLQPACREHSTGIEWEATAESLVRKCLSELKTVAQILSGVDPLGPDEVISRLARSRFVRSLRPFQLRDLGRLLTLPHGANFSVPGAGKTAVTYALYEAERSLGKLERLMIVCPLSAFDAWQAEAAECFSAAPPIARLDGDGPTKDAEILLVNYDRLPWSYGEIADWVRQAPTHIVLDEAHRVKRGWQGSWGAHSLRLAQLATRRDILTGTPAPQGAMDVAALIDFLWPNQARRILPSRVFDRTPPANIGALVCSSIAPLFVRTTKRELNLREPRLHVAKVPLSGHQREIYHALRNQYAGNLALTRNDRSQFARMGRVVMYLLEAATNPALLPFGERTTLTDMRTRFPLTELPSGSTLINLLEAYPNHEITPKVRVLAEMVRENAAAGRKTLVWTNFVGNILWLEQEFSALNPAIIFGGIPSELRMPNAPRTREMELAKFRNDQSCKVLIANPAATSEGVSLHMHCHDAIYLDRTFNAGHYLQSVDRIHRLGMRQDVDTNITFLVTEETIDVSVTQRVQEKALLLGEILNDPAIGTMSLPDEESNLEYLDSNEDVAALFRHLRGEDARLPECGVQ